MIVVLVYIFKLLHDYKEIPYTNKQNILTRISYNLRKFTSTTHTHRTMVGVIEQPIMNGEMEDEIYMQRRHDVAMEGLEEELEEGEVLPMLPNLDEMNVAEMLGWLDAAFPAVVEDPPHNPFEEGDDFIQLPPELGVPDEEWDMPGPLERQNAIDPFEEAAEEDDRRREEWLKHNYEIAKNPNSRWEDINHNHLWRQDQQRARHQWIFPSNRMMEVDKQAVVIGYEFHKHKENQRLLAPHQEIPSHFKNRFLGIHLQCAECNCCDRHQRNRPEFGEIIQEMPADHQHRRLIEGEKENNCICSCRHIMRSNIRLMSYY